MMEMKRILFLFVTALSCLNSFCQDSLKIGKQSNFLVEPYLMILNLNSTMGLGSLVANNRKTICLGPDRILSP